MQSKRCFKCLVELPLSEFYKHAKMGDGHLNKCKKCTRSDSTHHRNKNIEKIRSYDRDRGNRQPPTYLSQYRKRYPNKYKATQALNYAVKTGQVQQEPCCICGKQAEAHHPDYDRPLDVVWLCPPHHKQAHALTKKAA